MRIYSNCKEAISEIQRDLFEMGIEVHPQSMQNKIVANDESYMTKELQGYSFMILNDSDMNEMVGECLNWCQAEFKERINGWEDPAREIESGSAVGFEEGTPTKNPGEAYKLRKEVWEEFLVDGKFCYTYNERMQKQIKADIEELRKNPDSRQVIIQFHNRDIDQDKMGGKSRVPCSMFYQLMIREGKLDIIYTMRSTDFFTHFKNDIWHAIRFRNFVAEQLNIPTGKFIMFASSLHAYKKDFPEGVY